MIEVREGCVVDAVLPSKGYGEFVVTGSAGAGKESIRFLGTGYQTTAYTSNIRAGQVKDKLMPNVCGVGFIGEGEFDSTIYCYGIWVAMLGRCYKETTGGSNKTYLSKGVSVSEDWHNFQNFAKWYTKYCEDYNIPHSPQYNLEKDILGCGKVYSDSCCCIVVKDLNQLYKDVSNARGWKTNKSKSKPYTCSVAGKWVKDFKSVDECRMLYGQLKLQVLADIVSQSTVGIDPKVLESTEEVIRNRFMS